MRVQREVATNSRAARLAPRYNEARSGAPERRGRGGQPGGRTGGKEERRTTNLIRAPPVEAEF